MTNKQMSLVVLLFLWFGISATTQAQATFTLESARMYAVENSYFTKSAAYDVDIAKKRVNELYSIGLPQINGDVSFQNFLEIPTVLVPDFTNPGSEELLPAQFGTEYSLNAGLSVNQLLFDGSYFVGLEASNTYQQLSKDILIKTEQEIKDMVTRSYANVIIADENMRTLKGNKTYLEKLLKETQALNEAGFNEEQDVDQIRLLFQSADNALKNGERARAISENMLKYQMGLPVDTSLLLSDSLSAVLLYANQGEVMEQQFDYAQHFDYKIAMTQQQLMQLDLKNEKAEYLPDLYGFYQYQQQYQANDFDLSNGDVWFPTSLWGLNLKVPIFSSFQRKFAVDQARVELDKAELNARQTEQQLMVDFLSAKSNYSFAVDQYKNSKENYELIQRILAKEQIKYNEGVSSSLDLANVQIQFFELQGGYIQSILNMVNAKSELDKALNNY